MAEEYTSTPTGESGLSLKSRYEQMTAEREHYLIRGRKAAKLTIPSLLPPKGFNYSSEFYTPFQGLGARGVNNLAAKLLLALFPPGSSFFRFQVSPGLKAELSQDPDQLSALEDGLTIYEDTVTTSLEAKSAFREKLFEILKHLPLVGNCATCIKAPKKNKPGLDIKVYPLTSYVVDRDTDGGINWLILEEHLSFEQLEKEYQDKVLDAYRAANKDKSPTAKPERVCVYKCVHRMDADTFEYWEEIETFKDPETYRTYGEDEQEYLVLTWSRLDCENYGRGHVEEYQGDLNSLEGITQAIVEGAAASAKVVFGVKPGGAAKVKDLFKARNGGAIAANPEDVHCIQVGKMGDLGVAQNTGNSIEKRLEAAFLLNGSVTRDAERVTAEEIRYLANELESALGGVYSALASNLQLPLLQRCLAILKKQKKIPKLPDDSVQPVIVTGVSALSRNADASRLDEFLGNANKFLGPQAVAQYLNVPAVLDAYATARGVNKKGFIKSAQQVQQEMAQAQQAAQQSAMAPHLIKAGADLAKTNPDAVQQAAAQIGPSLTGG